MRKRFLDVAFDDASLAEMSKKIKDWLMHPSAQRIIVTPGPAFVVRAWKEPLFKEVLNFADYSACDGFGIQLFSALLGSPVRHRITGVDVVYELCRVARALNKKVFLLGARNGVAQKTAHRLAAEFPGLAIAADAGPFFEEQRHRMALFYRQPSEPAQTIAYINAARPAILIVAFGVGKQEKWIHQHLSEMPSVTVAVGVGGALDMISGRIRRAPRFMRVLGLEWVWRTVREPWRITRAFESTARFLFLIVLVYKNRFLKPVRRNVLAIVLNKKRDQFLLINNRLIEEKNGEAHWQFVQGGVDEGETAQEALLRELEEETGTNKYRIIKKSNILDYSYPGGLHSSYSIKSFVLFYVELLGTAQDLKPTEESSGYVWSSAQDLIRMLNPMRKGIGSKILEELKSSEFCSIMNIYSI